MPGPDPAVALTRRAVRQTLRRVFVRPVAATSADPATPTDRLVVGVSGGADSLALAAALAFEAPKLGVDVVAAVVDHGLQPDSADVARGAAELCEGVLGVPARICPVTVRETGSGAEADARSARYDALRAVARDVGASHLALAHTGDDQAEQVLLGIVRGSGSRSLAGMRVRRDDVVRPFLLGPPALREGPVMRVDTVAACRALELPVWQDPHNEDPRFARVRARRLVASLEDGLQFPFVRRSLVRTAESAARDSDLLDRLTDEAMTRACGTDDVESWPTAWPVEALTGLEPALRIRAIRRLVLRAGAPASELTAQHLYDVENLLVSWRGQGPVHLPGHLEAVRGGGEVAIRGRERQNGHGTSTA